MTLEFAGNMLCSAGVSYFHVYPNSDVYRCLADFNARRPPMFNLKRDGWKGTVNPTVCVHEGVPILARRERGNSQGPPCGDRVADRA
jgi:hypothetical protein